MARRQITRENQSVMVWKTKKPGVLRIRQQYPLLSLPHNGQIVLAEGVETAEEKAVMNQLGVDLFQGYLFGKPNPQPVGQIQWQNGLVEQSLATV